MKIRVISGLIMTVVFALSFFLGKYFYIMPICLSIVAMIATNELLGVTKKVKDFSANRLLESAMYIITIALPWAFIFSGIWSVVVIANAILIVSFIISKKSYVGFLGYSYFMICLLGGSLYSISTFYQIHPYYFLYILLIAFGNDIFAYFSGYFFGKRKLIEWVSPNKTVEGAIGGIAGALFFIVLLQILYTFVYGVDAIPQSLNLLISPLTTIWMTMALSISSQIGDLFFSKIKRHFEVKDYSSMLPGHGGIMDRIDGVVFVSIVLLCFGLLKVFVVF
ncbi:MAG: phosphatidate cytidylyltransferase [Culicoidibacterales bacterium]